MSAFPDEERSSDSAIFRVELFVRSLEPGPGRSRQEAIVERVQSLDRAGEIETVDLYVTGDCVCPNATAAATDIGQLLLERVQRFQDWADAQDVGLAGFREQCIDSSITGKKISRVRFPQLCIAVFSDDEVELVAPCVGEREYTVPDTLNWLSQSAQPL